MELLPVSYFKHAKVVSLEALLGMLFLFVDQAKLDAQPLNGESLYRSSGEAVDLTVSNTSPKQGETIQISVSVHSPEKARQVLSFKFNGKSFPLFKQQDLRRTEIETAVPSQSSSSNTKTGYAGEQSLAENHAMENTLGQTRERARDIAIEKKIGLLAIPADMQPGQYSITVEHIRKPVTVINGKFPVQRLSLPPSKNNFNMSPGEKKAIEEAKETVSPNRFWVGPFMAPCKAPISAGFGLKRVVNGKLLKDYFHSGLDFRAPLGSSVHSCAPGAVVLAAQGFRLHGNTICIDHGQGVVSFYIHLKKLSVSAGQAVKQGQVIGTVGQTGRASGPHLHFSLYVNQSATNPIPWFKHPF